MRQHKIAVLLGRALIATAWLAVVILCVELATRLWTSFLLASNPYVMAEMEDPPAFEPEAESAGVNPERVARYFSILPGDQPPPPPPRTSHEPGEEGTRYEQMFYTYRPNFWSELLLTQHTNAQGFLDSHIDLPKPAGTLRIACLGGSTTAEHFSPEFSYPNVMERELGRLIPLPGQQALRRIDVINCGVEGLDTQGILERSDDFFALEPDVLMLYEGVNDLMFQILSKEPVLPKGIRPSIASWSNLYASLDPGALFPSDDAIRDGIRQRTIANFEHLIRIARQRGVLVVVCGVVHPEFEILPAHAMSYLNWNIRQSWQTPGVTAEIYARGVDILNEELRALAERQSCPYLPLQNHFVRIFGTPAFFMDICHLFPDGIIYKGRVAAEYMRPLISGMLDALSARGNAKGVSAGGTPPAQ